MRDYIKQILGPLITNTEALEISESEDDKGKLFSVRVSGGDMGRVIGKGGETIKAIRTIIHAAGTKTGERASIKVNEPRI